MSVLKNTSPSLPPISVFMQSNHVASSAMPASPPTSAFKSPPILPKPQITESVPSSTSPPDQQTLWLLFKQFQQYKSSNESEEHKTSSASSPLSSKLTISKSVLTEKVLSSEEVLAEKRRRNAGASARFRDRRKQRERELQEKCSTLEDRAKALENALKLIDPNHPLLTQAKAQGSTPAESQALSPSSNTEQNTLFDRVGQLEDMMYHFKQEKETDALKLDELERENRYLRSLLVPVTNQNITSNTLKTKTALEKSEEYEASMNKRIRSS